MKSQAIIFLAVLLFLAAFVTEIESFQVSFPDGKLERRAKVRSFLKILLILFSSFAYFFAVFKSVVSTIFWILPLIKYFLSLSYLYFDNALGKSFIIDWFNFKVKRNSVAFWKPLKRCRALENAIRVAMAKIPFENLNSIVNKKKNPKGYTSYMLVGLLIVLQNYIMSSNHIHVIWYICSFQEQQVPFVTWQELSDAEEWSKTP